MNSTGVISGDGKRAGRIHQLTTRLSNLQSGIENRRARRLETIEAAINELDERIINDESAREAHFDEAKTLLMKIHESICGEQRACESLFEAKGEETEVLKNGLRGAVGALSTEREDSLQKIAQVLDTKTNELMDEVQYETILRNEATQARQAALDADFPRLKQEISVETTMRKQQTEELELKAQQALTALRQALKAEQTSHQQMRLQMQSLIDDIANKMNSALAKEQKEREEGEETLMKLLEQTTANYISVNDNLI